MHSQSLDCIFDQKIMASIYRGAELKREKEARCTRNRKVAFFGWGNTIVKQNKHSDTQTDKTK